MVDYTLLATSVNAFLCEKACVWTWQGSVVLNVVSESKYTDHLSQNWGCDFIDMVKMRFLTDVILACVRWYDVYPLSYRRVDGKMAERGGAC